MGKTGGGRGTNQHQVKGVSQARAAAASRKPSVPDGSLAGPDGATPDIGRAMSERFAADLFPAFCETAVWAADVEGAGFGDGQAAQVRQDLADWHGRHRDLVAEAFDNAPRYRDGADGFGGVELFAHDLCLTAGGHGTGFWDQSDRDVPEGLRDRLTAAAHDLPERSLW